MRSMLVDDRQRLLPLIIQQNAGLPEACTEITGNSMASIKVYYHFRLKTAPYSLEYALQGAFGITGKLFILYAEVLALS